jgi:hypothetical protein
VVTALVYVQDVYLMKTKASEGKAKYLIGLPTALIISLHGGRSAGDAKGLEYSHTGCTEFVSAPLKGDNIVLIPGAYCHYMEFYGRRGEYIGTR